ncbi:MAG: Na+/H+ antiporter subunit A [Bacillota bacterium]
MFVLHAVILVPFMLAVLIPLTKRIPRLHTGWIVLPLPASLFLYLFTCIPAVQAGRHMVSTVPWMPSLDIDITLYLDGLSLLFSLLITGMGTLVVLYSIYYLNKRTEAVRHFYIYLLMFMGAMLGVVLSDNLMVLYGFWELTSISSFLLIAFWYRRERSRYGALKSMLITVFGGLAMFAGFNLLYVMSGTYSVREIMSQVDGLIAQSLFIPAMLLILLGAFTKSAQFPFHIWLPDAMEAPTPVSAYLHSATMVKAGLYLVARLSPIFAGQSEWFWLVSLTGLITLLYGSFKAIKQTDLKAMLAFSTISQLGLIMCLLGLGSAAAFFPETKESLFYTMATTAAIFHLMNHAIFKGSLFMVVGIIDHETNTRDLRRLGGLISLMPITFTVALIGAFSMAGLPPFNGFLSKEMFFTAVLNIREFGILETQSWMAVFAVIAWIASIFTFVYSMIIVFKTFTGKLQEDKLDKIPHEAPLGLLISPVILASLAVVFGIFPNLLSYWLIEPTMASVHNGLLASGSQFQVSIHFWHGWTPEVFMTLGVAAAGTLLYRGYGRFQIMNREWRGRFSLNRAYDSSLFLLERGSNRLTNLYMTGSNRHYLLYIFGFFIIALGSTLLSAEGITLGTIHIAPVSFYEVIIIVVMLLAALAVPFASSRVVAILFTGAVGYMVTLLFVMFRAPDLALTQMIVETVSVILFLLCFRHLPKLKKDRAAARFRWPNLIIAVGVGITVTLIALAAFGSSPFIPISEFFLKESYNLAGGKNVVNVILVDFRGFDTLFEIMVLAIASLGIYALIKLKLEPAGLEDPMAQLIPDKTSYPLKSNDVILKMVSKVMVVMIFTFSMYLFFAGHNNPGGGFIGALMTSAALILLAIAFGMDTIRKVLPINYRILTAVGLIIAILTAAGSFAFGAPFLSHTFGHFHLPIMGDTELATAVLFDLGVYLAVVGVTMNIIFTIKEDE